MGISHPHRILSQASASSVISHTGPRNLCPPSLLLAVRIDRSILEVIQLRLRQVALPQQPALEEPRRLLRSLELGMPTGGDAEDVIEFFECALCRGVNFSAVAVSSREYTYVWSLAGTARSRRTRRR